MSHTSLDTCRGVTQRESPGCLGTRRRLRVGTPLAWHTLGTGTWAQAPWTSQHVSASPS